MLRDFSQIRGNRELGQASPFAILVAALLGILALALLCTGGVYIVRQQQQVEVGATSTAIAIANATTLADNARVTQTIAARETEAARPTETSTPTPVPTNTATATATATPEPTATEEIAVPEADETPTPNFFVTSVFEGTPAATVSAGGVTGGGGTLPQTGAPLGLLFAAVVVMIGALAAVRRMRGS
jgi:cell division septation protein DedD